MAQPRLSKSSQRLAITVIQTAERVGNLARQIDDTRVKELVRRCSIPIQPDGYPSNSMPEHTSGGSGADPTFGTVLASERPRRDPVAADLRRLFRDLDEAESRVRAAIARLDGIDHKVEARIQRQESTPCSICLQLPAAKSGYCASDYQDWWRHGRPDRAIWELFRRKEVNSEGVLLVAECPPPSEGNVAAVGPYRRGAPVAATFSENEAS